MGVVGIPKVSKPWVDLKGPITVGFPVYKKHTHTHTIFIIEGRKKWE